MNSRKGFMLVELLLVIAVGAVLIGVLVKAIDPVSKMQRGRDAKRKHDINMLANALRAYEVSFGQYPWIDPSSSDTSLGYIVSTSGWSCGDGTGWQTDLVVDPEKGLYNGLVKKESVKSLPVDPLNRKEGFCYLYHSYNALGSEEPCSTLYGVGTQNACRYWIGVRLEKPQDVDNPVFRCTDNETLSEGSGCKEVPNIVPPDN